MVSALRTKDLSMATNVIRWWENGERRHGSHLMLSRGLSHKDGGMITNDAYVVGGNGDNDDDDDDDDDDG